MCDINFTVSCWKEDGGLGLFLFICFSSLEPKVQVNFSDQDLSVVLWCCWRWQGRNFSHFHLFLQNHWANFHQTWHNTSLGKRDSDFPMGDNYGIHWRNWKIFFSRSTGPISTKHGTMHSCVKDFQICSYGGPHPFSRGDNYEMAQGVCLPCLYLHKIPLINYIGNKRFLKNLQST